MIEYGLWLKENTYVEAGFADFRQRLGDFISGRQQPQPQTPPPPNAPTQPTNDDPAVKNQKYQKLLRDFMDTFNRKLGTSASKISPEARNRITHSLSNVARSFTFGSRVHMSDINEILLAIHSSANVDNMVKQETFGNHERVLKFLQQVFEHDPKIWYNPEARTDAERFPPGTSYSEVELKKYSNAWKNSPFRSSHKEITNHTIADEVVDMFKDAPANMSYNTLKTIADALYKKAVEQGIKIEMGDLDKLRNIANGGIEPKP